MLTLKWKRKGVIDTARYLEHAAVMLPDLPKQKFQQEQIENVNSQL
jgi:hypothetical protein